MPGTGDIAVGGMGRWHKPHPYETYLNVVTALSFSVSVLGLIGFVNWLIGTGHVTDWGSITHPCLWARRGC